MANMVDNNMRYYKHRQGQKGKVIVTSGHVCKVDVEGEPCGAPATLSKTRDGVVKRTCSVHWHTPKQRANKATERLLRDLGLAL